MDPKQKITQSENASNSDFCFGIEALGGLRREQSSDASTFTLSLPARSSKFLLAQAIVAFGEALFLGFMPALLLPALSTLIGQTFSLGEALCYTVLLVGAGSVFYGWTVLLSNLTQ